MLDVFSDDRFGSPNGPDEVTSRPETLTDKPTLALAVNLRKMDRTFAFDIPHHLTHRVFRRNRQQHMDMIGHQMSFLDATFPLFGQLSKYRPKISLQFAIQHLPAVFRNED